MTTEMPQLPASVSNMVKFVRNSDKIIRAVSLKPPQKNEARNEHILRYVTEAGQEKQIACTPEVFVRVKGKRNATKAHSGLDMRVYHRFLLKQDTGTKLVSGIDIYPHRPVVYALERVNAPVHGKLVVEVNTANGDLEVVEYPDGVNERAMIRLLAELNQQGMLQVGDEVGVGFNVHAISGSRIWFDFEDTNPEGVDEDDVFTVRAN